MPTRPDFFYDCEPKPEHDIRQLLPASVKITSTGERQPKHGFEVVAQAKLWRVKRAKILAKSDKPSRELADKLETCGGVDGPCLSPACPVCCFYRRCWIISEVLRLLAERDDLLFATLIMPARRVPSGKLHTLDLKAALATLKRQLERASIPGLIVIGAVDLSLEIDKRTEQPDNWQPHVHLVVSGCTCKELRTALERHYPTTAEVAKPLRIDSEGEKDRARQVSYCFKSLYRRYVRSFDNDGKPVSKAYPLRDAELRELLCFIDQFSFAELMVLRGVRRVGSELQFTSGVVADKTASSLPNVATNSLRMAKIG